MQTLVVEDEASTRRLLEMILLSRGHEVAACADAESAWAAYQQKPYPLVLLDWLLPGMDGLALCRLMRGHPHGDSSVIVVATTRDQADDLQAVLEAGADDYITKPIDVRRLTVRLAIAEQQVRHLDERRRAQARIAEMVGQLERSRDDMLSILNQLRVGTAMTSAGGEVTFLSEAARRMLGRPSEGTDGLPWTELYPVDEATRQLLEAMCERPAGERTKVAARFSGAGRRDHWVDIEVQDDPRDPHRKTGKELVARAIHSLSQRAERPFVTINCAGLTESLLASQLFGHRRGAFTGAVDEHKGFFETANRGTIFLDEIGDIPPTVQTSLLRVLQEREILRLGESTPRRIDVRVLAATHRNLSEEVERGNFRADLLYRIRVARIDLPPVRERREDIPLLVGAFLGELSAAADKRVDSVSPEAMRVLLAYHWPGNVRELRSAIEFAIIRCRGTALSAEDLPPEVLAAARIESQRLAALPPEGQGESEEFRLRAALQAAKGNRTLAAKLMGVSRATFYRRLTELGISTTKGAETSHASGAEQVAETVPGDDDPSSH